jgi:two-component system, OmpR family, phosphate regulon sensor histidine kinase PhoR
VSQASQALWFDGVPLLVVGTAYLSASAVLAPPLWSERRRASLLDLAIFLVFPVLGVVATAYGIELVVHRQPLGGGVWLTFSAAIVTGLPAFLALAKWRERAILATGGLRVREAEALSQVQSRELASMAAVTDALGQGGDPQVLAGAVLAQIERLVGVEIACLLLIDDERREASGLVGRLHGAELEWFPEVRIDLDDEPSGVATAAREAAPFAVYDAAASNIVSPRLVEATRAKSLAFVPLIADDRVIAVLVVGTADAPRVFVAKDLALLQTVASEAALALDHARSTRALAEALDRERFVARISARVRSELDIDELLRVAVRETGTNLGVDRCLIRLGSEGDVTAQWQAPSLAPLRGGRLPVSNLAARLKKTVAIEDVEAAPELDDSPPEDREEFRSMSSRAVLAVPIVIFDELLGSLSLHRVRTGHWAPEEIAQTEAVAREIGLAVRVAGLLRENERRIAQQEAFFRITELLSESLSFSATVTALARAAKEAFGAAFTAVLMPHGSGLELSAEVGLPHELTRELADGVPESADCLSAAARDKRTIASPSVARDDRFETAWRDLAATAGYGALVAVPVASPRAERAGLVLVFLAEEHVFVDADLDLARHLGDVARGALERSELFEIERTSRALSQQLAQTGRALATELDPGAVLNEVVYQAPTLLSADACVVRIFDEGDLVVSAGSGPGAQDAVGSRVPISAWLSGECFESRAPLAVENAAEDGRLVAADPVLAAGYTAFLGVPLAGPEGMPAGVLAVYGRRRRTWRPEEIDALLALAANASAALANAELYSRMSVEKERSVAILANVADGIVALDRDGKVVLWNGAAEAITGVPQEEAIGRTTAQILQRELESADGPAQSGPRLVSIHRGGDEVWLSLSEAVMRDPLGAVAGRIFAFRDISADHVVEQVKSDFVAAVSHELRTPLTSIYGFAETLLRQDIPFGEEERRTFLGYIASESERLTSIVDRLLNVAQLEAGDLQVNVRRIDVASVVSEVVEAVEQSGTLNGHRLEVDLPEAPLAVEADVDKVRQVFSILLENAVQYSPGGGTVLVGARRQAERVEVRVVDQGIGIPVGERERIFRKFYRAESASRDGAAGTGLGLFIARELVTAMGGRIWVDSTEGEGSSFAFELPAAGEDA